MSWQEILKWDREWFASELAAKADELVKDFVRKFESGDRLPYRLIAAKSELLGHKGWYHPPRGKSKPMPERVPKNIAHYARLLDIDRKKIPEKYHNDLDELIRELNELAGE
tara:strand:- start:2650 stop:2982 length:333 start_codon:yes stop_codon:yes gene_type:complete